MQFFLTDGKNGGAENRSVLSKATKLVYDSHTRKSRCLDSPLLCLDRACGLFHRCHTEGTKITIRTIPRTGPPPHPGRVLRTQLIAEIVSYCLGLHDHLRLSWAGWEEPIGYSSPENEWLLNCLWEWGNNTKCVFRNPNLIVTTNELIFNLLAQTPRSSKAPSLHRGLFRTKSQGNAGTWACPVFVAEAG